MLSLLLVVVITIGLHIGFQTWYKARDTVLGRFVQDFDDEYKQYREPSSVERIKTKTLPYFDRMLK